MKKNMLENSNLEDSLDIAEYLIRAQLYIPEVANFVERAAQTPGLQYKQKSKIEVLQGLLKKY